MKNNYEEAYVHMLQLGEEHALEKNKIVWVFEVFTWHPNQSDKTGLLFLIIHNDLVYLSPYHAFSKCSLYAVIAAY